MDESQQGWLGDLGFNGDTIVPTHTGAADPLIDEAKRDELGQWFTPAWAAMELVDSTFPDLTERDLGYEPAVGKAAFYAAIPKHVPMVGTEIDPAIAAAAQARTGRDVIVGDFRTAQLPEQDITFIVGNLPFELAMVDKLLERGTRMRWGLRCALLLPTYMFQTYDNVIRWHSDFSYSVRKDCIPRGLFPGLKHPLDFLVFTRERNPQLQGFRLYYELRDVRSLSKRAQDALSDGGSGVRGVWANLVKETLQQLGGCAKLQDIYRASAGKRPTENPWWKQQIRKVLQEQFARVGEATYALPQAA